MLEENLKFGKKSLIGLLLISSSLIYYSKKEELLLEKDSAREHSYFLKVDDQYTCHFFADDVWGNNDLQGALGVYKNGKNIDDLEESSFIRPKCNTFYLENRNLFSF